MTGKLIVIMISLGLVLVTAAVGSLAALPFGGWKAYFASFCGLVAIQMFIGKLWNYSVDRKINLQMRQVEAANAMAEAAQLITIDCAYCGTTNKVHILVGEENKFECTACHQETSIILNCQAARTTKPIMPKKEAAEIFRSLDNG